MCFAIFKARARAKHMLGIACWRMIFDQYVPAIWRCPGSLRDDCMSVLARERVHVQHVAMLTMSQGLYHRPLANVHNGSADRFGSLLSPMWCTLDSITAGCVVQAQPRSPHRRREQVSSSLGAEEPDEASPLRRNAIVLNVNPSGKPPGAQV